MAEGKGKKTVTVQVPDDISVDLVASAIRARGSDDGGAMVCSVKKIKDYILEKEPNRDIQMLNKRLKEALILGVEENVIQRPTQQSHAKPDLRGSFQVPGDVNHNVQTSKTANKAKAPAKDEAATNEKGKGAAKKSPVQSKPNEPSKSETGNKGKKSKKAIISDDEEEQEQHDDKTEETETTNEKVQDQSDENQEEAEDEEVEGDEEKGDNEEAEEEEFVDEEDEGEEEQLDEEEGEGEEDEDEEDEDEDSPTKAFLPKSRKGQPLAALSVEGKESKSMKGRKL